MTATSFTMGVKGKAAAAWLATQGIAPLPPPNSWLRLPGGDLILRLGRGEYLLTGSAAETLSAAWRDGQPELYRVPRYDAGFFLSGEAGRAALAEICTLDVRPPVIEDRVVMTLAAGISVILICQEGDYRIWCDASYGDYLQRILQQTGKQSFQGDIP